MDEPMPTTSSDSRPVQPEAIKRFTETFMSQWAKGRAKYNSDLVAYIVQMSMENADMAAEIERLKQQLRIALQAANNA